jgi:hypothetical protein
MWYPGDNLPQGAKTLAQIDDLFARYMTTRLTQFRAELEQQARQPLPSVHTDAARLLSDLCRFCGLDEQQHDRVLGENGVRHVHTVDRSFKHHAPASGPQLLS